ncbi:hypothetical protein D030_0054A, partial [Vibrio parahaemolyticus AQ3810]|jgi:hypothetical protein
MPK